jgi:hypothetical protein
MSGAVTGTATWSGIIFVTGDLSIRNEATITIQPGTKFIVALGATIEFGWQDSHPTLYALGTEEQPILICGETDRVGYWSQLVLRHNVNPSSTLSNVLVSDSGGGGSAITIEGSAVLDNVQIIRSGGDGVTAAGFGPNSRRLLVTGATGAPLNLTTAPAINGLPVDSLLTGNGRDVVKLSMTTIQEDVRLLNPGVPYLQMGALTVSPAAGQTVPPKFVMETGVNYRFNTTSRLSATNAVVDARGTAAAPVVVGDPSATNHGGVVMGGGSKLVYTTIDHGGLNSTSSGQYSALEVWVKTGETVLLDHLRVVNPAYQSLRFASSAGELDPASQAISVELPQSAYDQNIPVSLAGVGWLATLPADTVLPVPSTVLLQFGTFDRAVTLRRWGGVQYTSGYGLTVNATGNLVIEPGVTLNVPHETGITLMAGSTFTAQGTAALPIQFLPAPNPYYSGCDTHWIGMTVQTSSAWFDHVVFDRAGYGYAGAVSAALRAELPVTVTNSTFSNSCGWGILHAASDLTAYATSNTFTANSLGNIGTY